MTGRRWRRSTPKRTTATAAPEACRPRPRDAVDGRGPAARLLAAAIALSAWGGLAVFFAANHAAAGSTVAALTRMGSYFTNLTNLALAVVFTGLWLGPRSFEAARAAACGALAIAMVGVVYFTLLGGWIGFDGPVAVANALLHAATPALTPLYWLLFVRKGALRPVDPWLFALFPLAYLGVTIIRGAVIGTYPYQFLNVARLGLEQTLLNTAPIAVVFLTAAWAMLLLDRALARRTGG